MYRIVTTIIAACAILAASAAMAQTDAANMDNARSALDTKRSCDDAMHYLNLVSPDSRLAPDYLLCMARTQDCKNNREQALYYYNKYLQAKPGSDSVMKRVAELKDDNNRKAHVNNDERIANDTYHKVAKKRKRRGKNLDDNYGTFGMSYGMGLGGDKSPYKSSVNFDASYGFMMFHDRAVFDITSITGFLLSPNSVFFANAFQAPAGAISGISSSFSEVASLGVSAIIINKHDIALTVGPMAGLYLYFLPSNGYGDATFEQPISLCYGISSGLYLGENVTISLKLILTSENTATVTSYAIANTVPANYNMLNIGISYKFDNWW